MLCHAYTELRSKYLFLQNTYTNGFMEILTETDERN